MNHVRSTTSHSFIVLNSTKLRINLLNSKHLEVILQITPSVKNLHIFRKNLVSPAPHMMALIGRCQYYRDTCVLSLCFYEHKLDSFDLRAHTVVSCMISFLVLCCSSLILLIPRMLTKVWRKWSWQWVIKLQRMKSTEMTDRRRDLPPDRQSLVLLWASTKSLKGSKSFPVDLFSVAYQVSKVDLFGDNMK